MLTLFKPNYEKILRCFYEDKTASIHVRELARRSLLHEPSVCNILRDFEQQHIVNIQREGNLKKYSLKQNKLTAYIYEYFDLEKFNALPRLRQDAINTFLHSLAEQPICVILFGSTAKQTYKNNSDIDLLIISNKRIDLQLATKQATAITGIPIQTIQITFSKYLRELRLKEDKVIQSALFSGYPVYNNRQYHEVLLRERV